MYCTECGLEMNHYTTVEKSEQLYRFFQCPKCGLPAHDIQYKYTPHDCPLRNGKKHQWEFIGQVFEDNAHAHKIWQVDRCDLCGAVRKTPRHTTEAGISGRIDLDDPRVKLLLNSSSMKRLLSQEIMSEFGGNLPKIGATLPLEAEI